MKEISKLITEKHINFMMTNDRFFKFIFTSKPEDTAYLCNLILGHMLEEQYESYAIIDSHLHSRQHEKQMIYDLLFEADNARRINIEMQNYRHPYMMARFDMYLASLFTKGLEDYRYAKQTVQIIFINDRDKEMIDEYEFVNGWKRRSESWKRFFVHLGNMEDIVRKKGIDNFGEFEKLAYIFAKSNLYDIMESERRTGRRTKAVEIMERKVKEYLGIEDNMWEIFDAMNKEDEQRQRIEDATREGIEQGIEQGLQQGVEKGLEQGEMESIQKLSKNLKITVQEAMELLDVSDENQKRYLKLMKI